MKRIPVSSSNILSIGYSPRVSVLEVEFNSGDAYRYFDVPKNIYHEFMNARSKSRFLNNYIKYNYRYQKVR